MYGSQCKFVHRRNEENNSLKMSRNEKQVNRGEKGLDSYEREQTSGEGIQEGNMTWMMENERQLGQEEIRKEIQEQISFLGQKLRNLIENTINSTILQQQQWQQKQQYAQPNHYQQVYPQPWNIGGNGSIERVEGEKMTQRM